MKVYHKIATFFYNVLRWITAVIVLAMLLLMLIEVVRRYIFAQTWPWSDEVIRYLLLYCTFFGGACAYFKKGLVAFTLVFDKFPKKVQSALLLFNNCVMLVFFGFLIKIAFEKATSKSVVSYISTSSGLSGVVPYIAILIGLIFLFIFTIDFFPELITNFRNDLKGDQAGTGKVSIREEANK